MTADFTTLLAGGQKLLEAYARVQQLRGMSTVVPANISPALQQTSKACYLPMPCWEPFEHMLCLLFACAKVCEVVSQILVAVLH